MTFLLIKCVQEIPAVGGEGAGGGDESRGVERNV